MGKEILKLVTVVALIVGTLGSCKKEAGLKYSCDENIHQFVSQHLDTWEGIALEGINMYGIDTQRAIFNAISDENKAELWREKIAYIKSHRNIVTRYGNASGYFERYDNAGYIFGFDAGRCCCFVCK